MNNPLIFLSHSGEDTPFARELAQLLRPAGVDVWLDVERLEPGDRWGQKIEDGLRQATAMVLYVGKSGVQHWVDQEVRVALDRSTRDPDFRLIPVLGEGSNPEDLPLFLKQYQWLDLREGWSGASQLKSLIEGATRRQAEGVSLLPSGKPPFRGLQAFGVEDSLLFFGREAEIQDLLDKLRVDSFLAVVGDSGSGKSSLVRAGLIPALNRGRFHDGKGWIESWRVAIVRPGEDPFGELAESLCDLNPGMPAGEKADFLRNRKEVLSAAKEELRSAIASLVPSGTRTLLVVDQFEELFTSAPRLDDRTKTAEAERRRAYVDSLFYAAKSETLRPVHVLITLRADFYSYCWEHPELTKRMSTNQYNVRRASAERLRDVIEKPLALAGAKAQPGLVDAILSDAGDEPGNLPLLEHALSQLWEKRARSEITHDAYKQIGRLSGALRNHADSVLKSLGQENRPLARKIFLSLTQLGEEAEDTRRRVKKADLIALSAGSDQSERVLKVLTDTRLLTSTRAVDSSQEDRANPVSESSKPDEILEVSHEALIREWPELRKWVDDSRDDLQFERRVSEATAEWEKGKKDIGLLWSGTRLARASEWAQKHETEVPSDVRAFLDACQQQARLEARKAKRLRALVLALASVVLVMVIGFMGWTTYRAKQQAKELFDENIVTDPATGLMWTRNDNFGDVTWQEAEQYCRSLSLAGLSGWELPTIEELEKLYDPQSSSGYQIRKPLRLTGDSVWSSTKDDKQGSGSAWNFYFAGGQRGIDPLGYSYYFRALCVRRSGK